MTAVRGGHAIVIGAGMAGLAVAKALTAGFRQVTIVERDRLPPPSPGHRRGVPQDRHLHLLLPAGIDALEQLLEGLVEQLRADGAVTAETDRIRLCLNGHRLAPARSGQPAVVASRPFLEAHVRRHGLVGPTSEGPRGGAMTNVEDGSWLGTLFAMAGERAPTDDRSFERLDELPAGLLAAGDAVCSFNPIYGQGMSVAALEAQALQLQLGDGTCPSARTWFRRIARVIDTAWQLAVGADLAVEAVQGRRPVPVRVLNRYLFRLQAAAVEDPRLTARLIRVVGLVDPPTRLLSPTTIWRVLRGVLPAR